MSRPTLDEYWKKHLLLVTERSTCLRRKTAAIITDERGAILSSGYNGIGSGIPHCGRPDSPCSGEGRVAGDSGNETTNCWATHAEANAILQCHRLDLAHTIYCTNFPCFSCAKLIVNTPICRVIALEDYPGDTRGRVLLTSSSHKNMVIAIGGMEWTYEGAKCVDEIVTRRK